MLEKLQEDCYLTLDLTHGLRSCPIVFSVAVQYIKFLRRKIEIEGFYYGMLESKNAAGASPIVNLQVYLDLMEWIYAVRIFRDTRTTSRLIEQFERITESSKEQIITNLQEFNKYYELAAPIKLGETAASLGNDLRDHLPPVFLDDIPLGVELAGEVAVLIGNFSSTPDGEMGMTGELDILELERQGRIVDVYFETGQINHAVGLVREWIVSALLYHNGNKAKWRQRDERSQIEKQINNKHENDVNNRWNHVRKLRNELHHHGMQDSGTYSIDEAIELVKEDWEILKDNINNPNYWILKFERCSK
jgi:CRISPR-associated DxTHG motif protein